MSIFHLIVREILHRKVSFLLGMLSVLAAVGCVTAALTLLKQHDLRTEEIVAAKEEEARRQLDDFDRKTKNIIDEKEAQTKQKMSELQDESRKITKDMGFNLQIVPKGQVLDPYAAEYASRYMPEQYARRFVNAKPRIVTVNHVLPVLEERLEWSVAGEQKTVFLIGVCGEVYIQDRKQSPILEAVPPGKLVVAQELAGELKLTVGQQVELLGEKFKIHQLLPARDEKDRHTVWMDLAKAQALLGKEGKINGILALECGCDPDRLPKITKEVGDLLPDTEVHQFTSKANTRADVRNLAAYTAAAALEQEKQVREKLRTEHKDLATASIRQELEARDKLRSERESLTSVLVPVVLIVSAALIGLLTFAAVRERRVEIAILRALGLRSRQILLLFLGDAVLMGLVGAVLGFGAGVAAGSLFAENGGHVRFGALSFQLSLFTSMLLAAPALACVAAWLPALAAARRDPADILCEE